MSKISEYKLLKLISIFVHMQNPLLAKLFPSNVDHGLNICVHANAHLLIWKITEKSHPPPPRPLEKDCEK